MPSAIPAFHPASNGLISNIANMAQLAIMSRSMKEAFPGIELGSVDGFQGREKEVVIVSLVRSNSEKEVGFLGEKRRLNGTFDTLLKLLE